MMEDKYTNQEEQLRSLADDFSMDIDTSELWSNIESKLPPTDSDKRRPILWWWIGSASVFILAIVGWTVVIEPMNPEINESSVEKVEVSSFKSITPDQSQDRDSEIEDESERLPIAERKNIKVSNSIATKNSFVVNKQITKTTLLEKQTNTATANTQKKIAALEVNYSSYDEKSTARKAEAVGQSNPTEDSPESSLINTSDSKLVLIANQNVHKKDRDVISKSPNLSSLSQGIEWNQDIIAISDPIKPANVVKWLPFFAVSSGVNSHANEVNANGSEPLNLSSFEQEVSLPGSSSSMRFGYESSNGWRLGIGVSHSRLVNRYRHQKTKVSVRDIPGTTTTKINDDGTTIGFEGILVETTITEIDQQIHRVHDFVDVQLLVGRKLIEKGNFAVTADASIGKNMFAGHQGYYFGKDGLEVIQIEEGGENVYGNAGFSAGVNLSLEYRFDQLAIQLMPFATKGLNSFTNNTNTYQIKNSQYGLQLGIVYRP